MKSSSSLKFKVAGIRTLTYRIPALLNPQNCSGTKMIRFPTLLRLSDAPSQPQPQACLLAAGHKRYALTSGEAELPEQVLTQEEVDALLDAVTFGLN
jgi:hypothetical protein